MSFYESVFIARQDVTSAQVDGLTETFEKIITKQGGSIAKTESWGLRTLAYRIKKNRKGYYVLLNIDAPPAAIQEMERQMQLNEDVIRFLTTRVDEMEEGPSAVLKARERGDDRDRDRGRRGGYDKGRDQKPLDKKKDKDAGTDKAAPKDAKAPDADKPDAKDAKAPDADKPKAKSAETVTPEKETAEAAGKDEKAGKKGEKDEKAGKKDQKAEKAGKTDKNQGGDK